MLVLHEEILRTIFDNIIHETFLVSSHFQLTFHATFDISQCHVQDFWILNGLIINEAGRSSF